MTEKTYEQAEEAVRKAEAEYREAAERLNVARRELHLVGASEPDEAADKRAAKVNAEAAAAKAAREAAGAAAQ